MTSPVMRTGIVIRRPVDEVFDAVVEPDRITRIWYDRTSGPLEPGASVRWTWSVHGASADVEVEAVELPGRLVYRWGDGTQPDAMTTVSWIFRPHDAGTSVAVTEEGFTGEGDISGWLVDTTVGHTKVLCALKALLEHDVELRVVEDHD